MNLRYDSTNYIDSNNEIMMRVRLWTDPAQIEPAILMASQLEDWTGKSVVNASEIIYDYFTTSDDYESIQIDDKKANEDIRDIGLLSTISKVNNNISNSMSTAGNVDSLESAAVWVASKTVPILKEVKAVLKEYTDSIRNLEETYKNIIFIEHFPEQKNNPIQDNFTKEKFFIVSYKNGLRDEIEIIWNHSDLKEKYRVLAI